MGCMGVADRDLRQKPAEPPTLLVPFDRWSILIDDLIKKAKDLYPQGDRSDPVAFVRKSIRTFLIGRNVPGLDLRFVERTAKEDVTGAEETRTVLFVTYKRAMALVGAYAYGNDLYFAYDTWLDLGAWDRRFVRTAEEGCLPPNISKTVSYYDWLKTPVSPHEFHYADVWALGEILKHTAERIAREVKEIYHLDEDILPTFQVGGRVQMGSVSAGAAGPPTKGQRID